MHLKSLSIIFFLFVWAIRANNSTIETDSITFNISSFPKAIVNIESGIKCPFFEFDKLYPGIELELSSTYFPKTERPGICLGIAYSTNKGRTWGGPGYTCTRDDINIYRISIGSNFYRASRSFIVANLIVDLTNNGYKNDPGSTLIGIQMYLGQDFKIASSPFMFRIAGAIDIRPICIGPERGDASFILASIKLGLGYCIYGKRKL